MIVIYIGIAIVLIMVAQILADYENSIAGGSPFISACGCIIIWLSAGILLGTLLKCTVKKIILKDIRTSKRGLP